MKSYLIALCLMLCFVSAKAQDKNVKSASESVFTLVTSDANGKEIARTNGVFTSADGYAVAPWTPFKGATSAKVIDYRGQTHEVVSICGADEIYDVAKFKVKAQAKPLKTGSLASANSQAWIVGKKIVKANVNSVEKFKTTYNYYILGTAAGTESEGAAVVNDKGGLIGIFHKADGNASATDAAYPESFKSIGLTANDPVLRQCSIPVELPDKYQEAQLALMLSAQAAPANYPKVADSFIEKFPQYNDGYFAKAGSLIAKGDYAGAKKVLNEAVAKVNDKAEAHYNLARMAFQVAANGLDSTGVFTVDEADAETDKAISANNLPIYRHLKAQIKFFRGNYQDAYNDFLALTKTNLRNPELYLEMAQSKEHLKASDSEILSLLDSCIALCDTPYVATSAPYFLARGQQYDKMGEYRKAMVDYTMYEYFNRGRLGAGFYYNRAECEIKGKVYQQALNDLTIACYLDKQNPVYLAEKANLHLRVGQFDDAIESAKRCLELSPNNEDGLLILGLAQCQQGNKTEGLANLEKAKAAGNPQAENFIKKFK